MLASLMERKAVTTLDLRMVPSTSKKATGPPSGAGAWEEDEAEEGAGKEEVAEARNGMARRWLPLPRANREALV